MTNSELLIRDLDIMDMLHRDILGKLMFAVFSQSMHVTDTCMDIQTVEISATKTILVQVSHSKK